MLYNYCGIILNQDDLLDLIDTMLLQYKDIQRYLIEEKKNKELSIIKGVSNTGVGGRSGISDPTYKAAISFMKPVDVLLLPKGVQVQKPEIWINIIKETEREYEGNLKATRIFYARYIEQKTVRNILVDETITQKAYEKIIANFRWTTLICGISKKLFKIA